MTEIIETLLELQKLQLSLAPLSLAAESQVNELRAQVPKPILDHFDRLIAQGKTGVALARNGVCCGCHLRLSSGTSASLAHRTDIHICDNCGRYLYLPPAGSEVVVEKPPKAAAKSVATAKSPKKRPPPPGFGAASKPARRALVTA